MMMLLQIPVPPRRTLRRRRWHGIGWCWACLVLGMAHAADRGPAADEPAAAAVECRGALVCLPEEMHRVHGADLPRDHAHILGLRTDDRRYYTLLRTRLSEALFRDERLKAKDLVLIGSVYPGTHILDVTVIRSVQGGVVCDLYYWCDICAIKSVVPEECMCCHQPVVLTETPVAGKAAER